MWNEAEATWMQRGQVEYGIFQIDATDECPTWRRHSRGPQTQFRSVRNGLFGKQGARKACLGQASYPKGRYSIGNELFVPYVATWLHGFHHAYLVRPSAGVPEVTLVPVSALEALNEGSESELLRELAMIFGLGAEANGVRRLRSDFIESI
ncbi:hypothetical protein ACED29_15000 [Shewanella sp. 5S214]|uniref:hypothetical protein n=1 Tax=Shewanella sp. 5S214 TaxID=3229999 RepID=UPI00352D948F